MKRTDTYGMEGISHDARCHPYAHNESDIILLVFNLNTYVTFLLLVIVFVLHKSSQATLDLLFNSLFTLC